MSNFLTVKDVAEFLGVQSVTIYKWLREKKLEGCYMKIGGAYRFTKEKLDKVLKGFEHG